MTGTNNCIVTYLVYLLTYNLCTLSAMGKQETRRFDFAGSTNIVATVAGYQIEQQLASNVTVKTFSTDLGMRSGKELGVLFYVIWPTNYTGQYFMLSNKGEYTRTDKLYQMNKLYYFEFSFNGCQDIHPGDLFPISSTNGTLLHVAHQLGRRYYLSREEAIVCLEGLSLEEQQKETKLIETRKQLDTLEKPSKQRIMSDKSKMPYYQCLDEVYNINARLQTIRAEKKDLLTQLENMQRIERELK